MKKLIQTLQCESKINICFNYHDFSGTKVPSYDNSKYTIDFNSFKNHLEILTEIKNVPLNYLKESSVLEGMTYCLTFDDGHKSHLYIAEELAKRGLCGTFFIIRNRSVRDKNYLNASDVREISSMGMEIGSHSCTHRHLNRLKASSLVSELYDSKSYLEDIISKKVISIAFPGGHFGRREIEFAGKAGYLLMRTCIYGTNRKPLSGGLIKSNNITVGISEEIFRSILNISMLFFAKEHFRQAFLVLPKYLESMVHGGGENYSI